jgi:hypothetical protein
MRLTYLVPFFAASLVTACSAQAPDPDTGAASADVALANAPRVGQSFPKLSADATREVVEAFVQNNGSTWTVRPLVDDFLPFLRHIESTDALGSGPTVTLQQAQATAVDFIERNAGVLGVSADEIGRLQFFTTTDAHQLFDRQDARFVLGFAADTPRRGYESFPTVSTHTVIWVSVLADGRVVGVDQHYTERVPDLTFSTTPVHEPNDPTLTQNIVGLQFVFDRVFHGICIGSRDLGPITASDIQPPRLTIQVSRGTELAVDLGYAFDVTKRDGAVSPTLSYTVDTVNGRLLATPQTRCQR